VRATSRRGWVWLLGLGGLLVGGGGAACGDDCGNVDCSASMTSVSVDVDGSAEGSGFRLCVRDACANEAAEELASGGRDEVWVVLPEELDEGEEVEARLEVIDFWGNQEATYTGTAVLRPVDCCPGTYAELAVAGGRLVDAL
jgi:hypothetical protein